jgi:hypothetical protein
MEGVVIDGEYDEETNQGLFDIDDEFLDDALSIVDFYLAHGPIAQCARKITHDEEGEIDQRRAFAYALRNRLADIIADAFEDDEGDA